MLITIMELTRKQKVLKLIVEDFIKYAEPVGSQYLIEKYKLDISSATIRNVMAELENDGLLEKKHTSGGRIPSTLGYRYYIDNLRGKKVSDKLKREVQTIFNNAQSIEEIIKESCEILSSMTELTSVVLGPKAREEKLVSVSLVPLNSNSCTAIFVTDTGYVENKTFILKEGISMEEVKKCTEMLDKRLKGTNVDELVEKLESLKPIFSDYIIDYNYFFNTLVKTFYEFAKDRNEFYGTENIIKQPEFKDDAAELKKIFDLLNNPNQINAFIEKADCDEIIDSGEIDESYRNLAIIYKDIKTEDSNVGRIALIGPKRMDYENALNSLDYIIDKIIDYVSGEEDVHKKEEKDGSK